MIATLFRIVDNGSPLDQLSLVATPETSFVVITEGRHAVQEPGGGAVAWRCGGSVLP
jgi:hypothetical protein